ncbi:MAG: hypothetical protein DYH13_10180 [Alphaproteobacteria bacterium PRO2]|nr:hypothetical protein [Alphaproteobacteria bacterium PRO2]
MLIRFTLIALLAGFASPALAEGTSGMHYTKIQDTAPDSGTTHIRMKTVGQDEEPPRQEEPAQIRIWNKYKALASGKPEMTEEEKEAQEAADKKEAGEKAAAAEKAKQEEAEKAARVEQQPAPPTGIAAIIDEYRRNKAQRSQMRSLTITKPADFQPAAGETEETRPQPKPEG